MNQIEKVARAFPALWDLVQYHKSGGHSGSGGDRALANALREVAAIAAMQPAPQWQGIESAPRDGTVIDVWRDGHRETVYWGLPPHTCGEMGQYCDDDWHRIKGPGWVCSTFGEFLGGKHNPFTHWMPLPTPPAGGSDAE